MIDIPTILGQMEGNAEAMHALVGTLSEEQARWKPGSESWSMKDVMEHVYNEERIDFRIHLREILNDPPQAWGAFFPPEGYLPVETCAQALEGFLRERKASLEWLKALPAPDWDAACEASFGPSDEKVRLSAGDVLVSWVAHDYLHLRQMIEVLFAWNEKQASPYAVPYAGRW